MSDNHLYEPVFESIKLESGLCMAYARFGKPGGRPAFYFHGLPGSAAEGELFHAACEKNNIELFATERFGYGQSTPQKKANAAQSRYILWADSILQLANHLELEKFYIFGVSGGGPYALACASLLAHRVIATGVVAGLGPVEQEDLRNGMRIMATAAFNFAKYHPLLLNAVYGVPFMLASRLLPGKMIDLLGKQNPAADEAALKQPLAHKIMQANLKRAFKRGLAGARDDLLAAQQHWDFDLEKIKHCQIWHGDNDPVVPLSHSQWIRAHVPGSVLHIVKGESHFSLPICHAGEIVKVISETTDSH